MMIKPYLYAGAAIACFASGWFINGSLWQSKWDARDKADAIALVEYQERQRAQERQWQDDLQKVHDDAKKRQNELAADSAELNAAIERLRKQLQSAGNKAGSDTAVANISRAAATDKAVYSVLLESSIVRAGKLAEFADASRQAGLICEASYNAVRKSRN